MNGDNRLLAQFNAEQIRRVCGGRTARGRNAPAAVGVSTDTRTLQKGELFAALQGENSDGHEYLQHAAQKCAGGVLVSESYAAQHPDALQPFPFAAAVRDTAEAYIQLAAHVRAQTNIPVVGITGSNGKTSAKEWTAAVLGPDALKPLKSFNNRIGVPHTLLRLETRHTRAVLEMGTNRFGEIAELVQIGKPTVGVLLNVSLSHTEFLVDEDSVLREKSALPLSADTAVLNADDPRAASLAERLPRAVLFGTGPGAHVRAQNIEPQLDGVRFRLSVRGEPDREAFVPAVGAHQALNALAALAVGNLLREPTALMLERLASAEPPPMRMQPLSINGVHFINDCYNANPASVRAALDAFQSLPFGKRRWAVLGEMKELGERALQRHRAAAALLNPKRIAGFLPVGPFRNEMADAARQAGIENIRPCETVQQAADELRRQIEPGDCALLKASRTVQLEKLLETFQPG